MPNDIKAILSVVVLVVAAVLGYWGGSPVRQEFGTIVMVTAALMVVAMWVFPEAVGKKEFRARQKAGDS